MPHLRQLVLCVFDSHQTQATLARLAVCQPPAWSLSMLLPFLHDRIAVIDLAITGTAATSDGIAEIGILRIALGKLIEEWSSLVNPKMSIPYSFLKLMIEKRLAGTTCFSYS